LDGVFDEGGFDAGVVGGLILVELELLCDVVCTGLVDEDPVTFCKML
jgi:hypothetical protein